MITEKQLNEYLKENTGTTLEQWDKEFMDAVNLMNKYMKIYVKAQKLLNANTIDEDIIYALRVLFKIDKEYYNIENIENKELLNILKEK